MDAFIKKFQINKLLIKKFEYWSISLRPLQTTLGSLVISLNRSCSQLSGLTYDEAAEMKKIFEYTENILAKSFAPDKINYLALMMVDNQVHFHVIPRYKEKRIFEEQVFSDKNWPAPPDVLHNECRKEFLLKILKCFRDGIDN